MKLSGDPAGGDVMGVAGFGFELGYVAGAAFDSHVTAGMEGAAGGGIDRAGYFTTQNDALGLPLGIRLGDS